MGYDACVKADEGPVDEGNCGAGTGATVGKVLGMDWAMKGGLGTAAVSLGDGVVIGALAIVNAWGDVLDWRTGEMIAGVRDPEKKGRNTVQLLKEGSSYLGRSFSNTTLAVVASNARLSKEEVNKAAQMAQNGLARSLSPAHSMYDGDVVFALSTGDKEKEVSIIGAVGSEMVAESIKRAVMAAETAGGIPAADVLI